MKKTQIKLKLKMCSKRLGMMLLRIQPFKRKLKSKQKDLSKNQEMRINQLSINRITRALTAINRAYIIVLKPLLNML